ncbi:aldolase/citrate lyase family protein [Trujillonella endophytica]|uniref:4-hydroxy-2-oxoheptanedioate aldolase n=1 Tax=Trujillonella endophytica TaxID=673521 RepID=A0A1H8UEN6_9ACTN|nr:aldolase/citrate lyase family protein [Trujillella endophytica]SEP01675.1 4-hydroxy-2-oxoheptanedioate aldolase [Trujillella endophytica]
MSDVHAVRSRLRAALASGERLTGVFVKLPSPDVLALAAAAGFDFVVVDLEHSALTDGDAIDLLRYADALGLPALVRLAQVDAPLVNRVLEAGAVGIQLSMLSSVAQREQLQAAVAYGPVGRRSVSLAHAGAGYGAAGLTGYLDAERAAPPLLVGQIECRTADPLERVVSGLDVAFVGTTDLTVALGLDPADAAAIRAEVDAVAAAARGAGVAFGGWAPRPDAADGLGLGSSRYLVVGSDLQFLGAALRAAAPSPSPSPSPES